MKIKKYSHVFICYFIVSNDTVVPVICGVCVENDLFLLYSVCGFCVVEQFMSLEHSGLVHSETMDRGQSSRISATGNQGGSKSRVKLSS